MQLFSTLLISLIWQLAVGVRSSNINNISWPAPASRAKLEIWPELVGAELGQKLLLHKKDEPLNMTCTVTYPHGKEDEKPLSEYTVDWKLPSHVKNNGETKIKHGQGLNIAWLWFERLAETYAGDYKCMAISTQTTQILSTVIHLSVKHTKHKIKYCSPLWFKCHSSNCITNRYLCDGKPDCEDGEDEGNEAGCGPDPCAGKIICGDRCIPSEWCCDQYNYLSNCSLKSQYTRPIQPSINPTFNDINFLQTTTYVLIGCATIFMFIFTVLVIAICRLQMKRAMAYRLSQQLNFRPHRRVPFHDLDIYLSRSADSNHMDSTDVTYNISSGIPLASAEPPPYSEIVFAMCNEDLPPPYESNEDLLYPSIAARAMPAVTSNSCEASRTLQTDEYSQKDDNSTENRESNNEYCEENDLASSKSVNSSNSGQYTSLLATTNADQTEMSSSKTAYSQEHSAENGFSQAEYKRLLSARREDESEGPNMSRCCNVENTSPAFNEESSQDAESVHLLLSNEHSDVASCQAQRMSSTKSDDSTSNVSTKTTDLESNSIVYNDER